MVAAPIGVSQSTEFEQRFDSLIQAISALPSDLRYVAVGESKKPIGSEWQKTPHSFDELRAQLKPGKKFTKITCVSKKKNRKFNPPVEWCRAIGVMTGEVSNGLVAVDHDGSSCDPLIERLSGQSLEDALPKTVSFTSGKPGRYQKLYRVPQQYWAGIESRAILTKHNGEQLNFRWNGNQSVICGEHPETGSYRWIEGCSPSECEIADAPTWMIEQMLQQPKSTVGVSVERHCEVIVTAGSVDMEPLFCPTARNYLKGINLPLRSDGSGEVDRSTVIWYVLTEAIGWKRLLSSKGIAVSQSPESYAYNAAMVVDGLDKLDRVIESTNPEKCIIACVHKNNGDESIAWQHFRKIYPQLHNRHFPKMSKVAQLRERPPVDAPPAAATVAAEDECKLAKAYRTLKAILGNRLRLNTLKNKFELDEKLITLDELEVRLATEHNFQSSSYELVARTIAKENLYSPVVVYLQRVQQLYGNDTSILDGIAERYFGQSDPFYSTLVKRWLIGAVARAMNPGCKMDTALILQGKQGYMKSSFFKTLASDSWFDDSLGAMSDKDERIKLHCSWIVEWAELESVFRRKDVDAVKAFLTSAIDKVRPPYAREVEDMARASVIVATTNKDHFLSDATGNRRYWVIPVVKRIDLELLRQERDRIWAAAAALYQAGEQWWLTELEETAAAAIAEEYQSRDAWHEPIANYLQCSKKTIVTTSELLSDCLQIDVGRQNNGDLRRAADVLKLLGWEQKKRVHNGRRQFVWILPIASYPSHPIFEHGTVHRTIETLENTSFEGDRPIRPILDPQKKQKNVETSDAASVSEKLEVLPSEDRTDRTVASNADTASVSARPIPSYAVSEDRTVGGDDRTITPPLPEKPSDGEADTIRSLLLESTAHAQLTEIKSTYGEAAVKHVWKSLAKAERNRLKRLCPPSSGGGSA